MGTCSGGTSKIWSTVGSGNSSVIRVSGGKANP